MKPAMYIGNIKNPQNRGTCVRTAEAFGVNLFLTDDKIKDYKYAQGTSNHIIWLTEMSEKQVIDYAKENNHKIVVIEDTPDALNMNEVNYPANPLFITGNENNGVSRAFIESARMVVKIPQADTYCRCLNTSVAASIVIQDWFNKNKRKSIQTKKDKARYGISTKNEVNSQETAQNRKKISGEEPVVEQAGLRQLSPDIHSQNKELLDKDYESKYTSGGKLNLPSRRKNYALDKQKGTDGGNNE